MRCLSSLCHSALFKLRINCSVPLSATSTGCSKIGSNIVTWLLPPFYVWMAPAGHLWEKSCEATWANSKMALPKFWNKWLQHSSCICLSLGINSLEGNICSPSHSSFSKVSKHSFRYSFSPAFCLIMKQRRISYRDTALQEEKTCWSMKITLKMIISVTMNKLSAPFSTA